MNNNQEILLLGVFQVTKKDYNQQNLQNFQKIPRMYIYIGIFGLFSIKSGELSQNKNTTSRISCYVILVRGHVQLFFFWTVIDYTSRFSHLTFKISLADIRFNLLSVSVMWQNKKNKSLLFTIWRLLIAIISNAKINLKLKFGWELNMGGNSSGLYDIVFFIYLFLLDFKKEINLKY